MCSRRVSGMVRYGTSTGCRFLFSSRRRHTRFDCDWSPDVCSSDRAPWEIRNCAAPAPHATRNADARMLGKVHSADRAEPPATDRKASTFSFTCAEDSPAPEALQVRARAKIRSASLHSFHEDHGEPLPVSLEPLVHDILQRLGEDPTREGLRQTPARVEASLRWLTRGYHMSVADVIGDALYAERHENLVCVRDIEVYSLCEHHLLPFFGRAHVEIGRAHV